MLTIVSDTSKIKPTKTTNTITAENKSKALVMRMYKENHINLFMRRKLTTHNSKTPRMYGHPKIHKENMPLRQIVSCIKSPTYKLSKFINEILTPIANKEGYSVKNSYEFVERIRNTEVPPGYIMISLDIVALFPNIPRALALEIVIEQWSQIENHTSIGKDLFLSMLKHCLDHSRFVYKDQCYIELDGMPMGGPLSPVIAELVTNHALKKIIASLDVELICLTKYVDDIFCLVPENSVDYRMSQVLLIVLIKSFLVLLAQDILFIDDNLKVESPCWSDNGPGTCVFGNNCRAPLHLFKSPDSICFFHEEHTPVICCPTDYVGESEVNQRGVTEPSNTIPTGLRLSALKCQQYSKNYSSVIYIPPPEEPLSISDSSAFAVMGRTVTHGEYPHMAAIGTAQGETFDFYCGGTLISERYILTAAHCSISFTPSIVRLGEHDTTSDADNDVVQDFGIENIILHPLYKSTAVYNDLALFRLSGVVQFSPYVRPACLVPDGEDFSGWNLIALGWGHTEFGGKISPTLQEVSLGYYFPKNCETHYQPGVKFEEGLKDSQICAGSYIDSMDTCQGDSGGPLSYSVWNETIFTKIHHLVGVTSFGKGCGIQVPSIYTKVGVYLDWIEGIAWN
ncbi:serine protease snake-like [Sergentomyia squamirostris]